ncbi:hypothetical protein AXX17_AT1G29670 [Arabidopsis thaliana]|uniref:Uncharacterized protein n=1 Tax=Arabidopsis thaliana TaxID=3702 RepID=A0A178W665_ARATH|nr:hypothetical protein AXX17_AT1G29670 [Arabidopsis thaliana]
MFRISIYNLFAFCFSPAVVRGCWVFFSLCWLDQVRSPPRRVNPSICAELESCSRSRKS